MDLGHSDWNRFLFVILNQLKIYGDRSQMGVALTQTFPERTMLTRMFYEEWETFSPLVSINILSM